MKSNNMLPVFNQGYTDGELNKKVAESKQSQSKEVVVPKIKSNINGVTITSLEIAELTGKRHDNVMHDIETQLREVLDSDGGVLKFKDTYIHPQNKQTYSMYRLPKREALIVVSGYSAKLRAMIIDRLEYLENEFKKQNTPQLPQNYLEALKALTAEVEQRIALEQKVEADKPKVEFYEMVSANSQSLSVGDFAKLLSKQGYEIGQNRLFAWLRNNGYIDNNNVPYQQFIKRGLFEVIEENFEQKYRLRLYLKTLITGKGQIYLAKKIRGGK